MSSPRHPDRLPRRRGPDHAPALCLAQRHGPVDVVTTPAAATLLETHPAVRSVIRYDKHGTGQGLARHEAWPRSFAPGATPPSICRTARSGRPRWRLARVRRSGSALPTALPRSPTPSGCRDRPRAMKSSGC